MGIVNFTVDKPGQIGNLIGGVAPRRPAMVTTDSLATVTAAGYINPALKIEAQNLLPTDIIDVIYNYNAQTNSGTYGAFLVAIANGVITLSEWTNPGNVLLPVTSGDVAIFNGTSGQIKDSSVAFSNAVDTVAPLVHGTVVANNLASYSSTNKTLQDSGIPQADVMQINVVNTLTSAGSIVANKVNGTEAANAVTADGMAGAITTSSLTTGGGLSYAITWTNTFISATSVVLLTLAGGTNTTENITLKCVPGAGTATLTIYNNTAATALNGTIIMSYLVM